MEEYTCASITGVSLTEVVLQIIRDKGTYLTNAHLWILPEEQSNYRRH